MARTASVATETLAYCTSCKMDLNHMIVALKGDRIAKVQCLTCKKEHVYRAPKGATEPTQPKASKKKAAASSSATGGHDDNGSHSIEVEWEKLMSSHRDHPLKPYSTKGQFFLGDKIKHPTFGEGIVGKLIYPNKLEVIFKTDVKVLIYAGSQHSLQTPAS
jgi:hypothetical protein